MERKSIGVIGLGDIAQKAYLPILGSHPGVRIEGIMSRRQETVDAVGDRYRIEGRYTELEALLARPLDAVFVHSPTDTHEAIVTACLERGLAVYVEKPLAGTLAACERLAEAASRSGTLLAVGFNRRFAPQYAEAKAWLEAAGGFDLAAVQKHRPRQQAQSARDTLYDDLIHVVDTLLWLGAGPHELQACLQERSGDGRLLQVSGSLALGRGSRTGGGRPPAMGWFSMNRQAGGDLERLELHGGGRSVEVVDLETAVWRDAREGERRRAFGGWDPIGVRRGFAGAIEHFLDCLDAPERCTIRADRVMESHRLIERLCVEGERTDG